VVGILLLLAAAIAPVVFPDSIGKLVRGIQKPKQIGVLIGVPDSSRATREPNAVAQVPSKTSASPAAVVSSQPVNSASLPQTPPPANAAPTLNPFHVAPADVQQAQVASAQPQPAASTNSAENAAAPTPDASVSSDAGARSSAQAKTEPPPTTTGQSNSQSGEKSVASKSKRTHVNRSTAANSAPRRAGSVRSRVIGITSDGRLILRLPSGRTAVVAPDEENVAPRYRNRAFIDRDQMFGPPPGFGPDYSPDD
jgi:hypothetical protein